MSVHERMSALETARSYIQRGWNPVPVPDKSKKPIGEGWQKRIIDETNVEQFFNGRPQNVGVLMGPTSGGLSDVDLDCSEAIAIAPYVLPKTGAKFGRDLSMDLHWLYVTTLGATVEEATVQFEDPVRLKEQKPKTMLVEIRVGGETGAQTVFPGSTHETGEAIKWGEAGKPAHVDDKEMLRDVRLLAALCLFARYWPGEGSRHKAALAIGGFLARAGYEPSWCKCFVEAIARARPLIHRPRTACRRRPMPPRHLPRARRPKATQVSKGFSAIWSQARLRSGSGMRAGQVRQQTRQSWRQTMPFKSRTANFRRYPPKPKRY